MKDGKINKVRERTGERQDMNFNGYLFMHAMFIFASARPILFTRCVQIFQGMSGSISL